MKPKVGRTRWAIAEGYIPAWSTGPEPQMLSHETACLLNASDSEAHVEITVYFSDRDPAGPYRTTVPGFLLRCKAQKHGGEGGIPIRIS